MKSVSLKLALVVLLSLVGMSALANDRYRAVMQPTPQVEGVNPVAEVALGRTNAGEFCMNCLIERGALSNTQPLTMFNQLMNPDGNAPAAEGSSQAQ